MAYIPSAQRALVGRMVRRYREKAGMDLADAAGILGCDPSKMSRIENGERGFRAAELRQLLTQFGVNSNAQDLLAAISEWWAIPGWWQDFRALPTAYLDYVIPETFASRRLIYAPVQVPEPLCIRTYAQALAAADPSIPENQEAAAVDATQARRQAVIHERRTELSVIIGEAALRQQVGGNHVLRQQLAHLAELTGDDYPHVTIRVLPFDAGAITAGGTGGFSLLQFDAIPDLTLTHVTGPAGGHCIHNPSRAASYAKAFQPLTWHALDTSQSARRIIQMANRQHRQDRTS